MAKRKNKNLLLLGIGAVALAGVGYYAYSKSKGNNNKTTGKKIQDIAEKYYKQYSPIEGYESVTGLIGFYKKSWIGVNEFANLLVELLNSYKASIIEEATLLSNLGKFRKNGEKHICFVKDKGYAKDTISIYPDKHIAFENEYFKMQIKPALDELRSLNLPQ